MASETGGIALLAMYDDEDDEYVEPEEAPAASRPEPKDEAVGAPSREDDVDGATVGTPPDPSAYSAAATPPVSRSRSPLLSPDEGGTSYNETLVSPVARSPTPPPFVRAQSASPFPSVSHSSSPGLRPASTLSDPPDPQRIRRGALAIVDYAHDEMAMSPEPEEGELLINGQVVTGVDAQLSEAKLEDRAPPGTVHILTPNTQMEPIQPSVPEQSTKETSMPMEFTMTDAEVNEVEVIAVASVEVQNQDPLSSFLPPPLTTKCSEELQEKINKFLAYKRAGKSFNADLRNRKDYRNPDFLQHAVRYQDIDQIGSCFSKEVFDPHGYNKSDYYDEIENEMKREIERKEQERKKSQKVEFVSGGTQPSPVDPTSKMSTQNTIATIPTAANIGLPPVSTSDAVGREKRPIKKSKWDKIDGDAKNPTLSGGQDNASIAGVHAAILTAANAGAGYMAFAQMKRKEAEVKRSSERRFDKRS